MASSASSRKKKSSKAERDAKKAQERERIKALIKKEGKDQPHSGSSRNSPAPPGSSSDRKTDAEKRFEEVQRKRVSLQPLVSSFRISQNSTWSAICSSLIRLRNWPIPPTRTVSTSSIPSWKRCPSTTTFQKWVPDKMVLDYALAWNVVGGGGSILVHTNGRLQQCVVLTPWCLIFLGHSTFLWLHSDGVRSRL
jgi:hypothetical protein